MSELNKKSDSELLKEMAEANLQYGHKKSRTFPKAKAFINNNLNGVEIINLEESLISLKKAGEFLSKIAAEQSQILFVATAPGAKECVKNTAEKLGYSHVVNRWLGGTLTNYKTLSQRVNHLNDLRAKKDSGEWDKYTKKERIGFDQEIDELDKKFDGLQKFSRLPKALIMVDPKMHEAALKEALRMNIPVVAVLDTDDDFKDIKYPIFASDSIKVAIIWIMSYLSEQIEVGQNQAAKNLAEKQKSAETVATT
ncbi:MAG: 30S ribosomal protein S2 [Candidatus Parcubacteria bacterium]|nr:30S ribosomal protein S2 [Candidatus Parcubacteria bacterium]